MRQGARVGGVVSLLHVCSDPSDRSFLVWFLFEAGFGGFETAQVRLWCLQYGEVVWGRKEVLCLVGGDTLWAFRRFTYQVRG